MSGRAPADVRNRICALGIPLIGESPTFRKLVQTVGRVANHSSATVVIRGETGTGKELVARAIHYLGARRAFAFVPVNCGALPETLAENELFGHRQGAFTGATKESMGLLRLAHKGTLFLDEVDSLSAKAQVALLRFLEDGRFRPLGAAKEEHADVRILAASNRCLEDDVRAGRFRQDLYYRLNLISLDVPPLRERTGDVHILSRHFLQFWAQRYSLPHKPLHHTTLVWFESYCWPGNVRELENLIHRECLCSDDAELNIRAPANLRSMFDHQIMDSSAEQLSYRVAKSRALQEFDRAYLSQVMQRANGNVTQAAKFAGKERRALGKLLKRHHIGHAANADTNEPPDTL